MAGDYPNTGGYVYQPSNTYETHACNCVGPQRGDPVCPCMMPAYREREAGRLALEFLRSRPWAPAKPRYRVKAGSRVVGNA